MNEMNVVIIGGIHHNTLGVIRSIGEAGVKNIYLLIISEKNNNILSFSKYISKNKIFYTYSEDSILECLNIIAADGKKRVIICCSDLSAEIVIKHQEELKKLYYTPSADVDISIYMSKEKQSELAYEVGLNIPISDVISMETYSQWSIFPCITKPIKSISGNGKADINISNNMLELSEAMKRTASDKVQIQEYIDKKIEYQLIGCSLDSGNKIIIPGYTNIIRQPINTNTGYLKYSPIAELNIDIGLIKKLIRKIGYDGLFSIEFLRDKNNKDYFLEINMRNDGNAYCVKSAGINLPYIWCYYQINKIIPANEKTTFYKPIWFIPEYADMKLGIKQRGVLGWLKDCITAQSHAVFNIKDPAPFLYMVFSIILTKLKLIISNKIASK